MAKIKTIDVNGKEWFDKANGNSYCSTRTTINFGMKSAKEIKAPYENGYESFYMQQAAEALEKAGIIKLGDRRQLWQYCSENNIILRHSIQRGGKKADVIAWGCE